MSNVISSKTQPRPSTSDLDAIADIGQLRAMIVGKDDTISYLRDAIERSSLVLQENARVLKGSERVLQENERTLRQNERALAESRKQLGRISGNHRLYQSSRKDVTAEAATLVERCNLMSAELRRAPELYQPSQFWEAFYAINMRQLSEEGLSNFKLTVNQNYQNYIPRTMFDPKVRAALKWFRANPSLRPLMALIENPDGVTHEGYMSLPGTAIFRDYPGQMALYRALVCLGWDYARAHDPFGLCDRLAEPEAGNPIRVYQGKKLISQDLATSVAEATVLLSALKQRVGDEAFNVLEIGGGYGRLAHALLVTQNIGKYIVVDIPPALHVSRWYLERLFPDAKFFSFRPFDSWDAVREEIEAADLIFLLPHQIEYLPNNYVDASVTISSLHEMLPPSGQQLFEANGTDQ